MEIKNRYTGAVIKTVETLVGANLRETDLSRADLSGADLHEANLCGAVLAHTIGGPLQITGSRHTLTFSAPNYIQIGCHKKTITWWLRHYKSVGKAEEYSAAEIKEYKLYLDVFAKRYKKSRGKA